MPPDAGFCVSALSGPCLSRPLSPAPQAMCTNDAAGQSFLKQCMQRAMPRADYGAWARNGLLVCLQATVHAVRGLLDRLLQLDP